MRTIVEEDRGELEANASGEENRLRAGLLTSQEGRILVTGLVLAMLYIAWLALGCPWSPDKSQVLMPMTVTHILFGRAAGMSFGYAMGLGHRIVVPVSMLIETLLVLLFYPLFVLSWRHLLVIQALRNVMERTHKAAETHRDTIRRFGIAGLMIFVWFPFWMTGPLVGCVIGFLLGLRPWLNLTVVLAGTYLAMFSWAILLQKLHERVAVYSPYAPVVLVAIVIVIVVGVNVLQGVRRENDSSKR